MSERVETLWEKEKLLLMSISPFPSVFRRLGRQTCKNQGLFGKVLHKNLKTSLLQTINWFLQTYLKNTMVERDIGHRKHFLLQSYCFCYIPVYRHFLITSLCFQKPLSSSGLLTHYQTTNFKLVQIETVCR